MAEERELTRHTIRLEAGMLHALDSMSSLSASQIIRALVKNFLARRGIEYGQEPSEEDLEGLELET